MLATRRERGEGVRQSDSASVVDRVVRAAFVACLVIGWIIVVGADADASIEGPCEGEATVDGVTYDDTYDTKDNAIRFPENPGGMVIPYRGAITAENMDYDGSVGVVIGPAVVAIADWGPDENPQDTREKQGDYTLGTELDNLVGIYEVRAVHNVGGAEACSATVYIKIEGSPLSTPIGLAAVIGAAIFLILMLLAAMKKSGELRGRPVLGLIMGLLFGLFLALVLQQFCIWPLDNLTVIGLPLLMALAGLGLGVWGPFGKAPPTSIERAV